MYLNDDRAKRGGRWFLEGGEDVGRGSGDVSGLMRSDTSLLKYQDTLFTMMIDRTIAFREL